MPSILTSETTTCRLWWDHSRPQQDTHGRIILDRAYLECVDCHALMFVPDWLTGHCARQQ